MIAGLSTVRLWAGVVVIFLCGFLVGMVTVTTYQDYQRTHRTMGLAGLKPRVMKHLTRELHLSEEQQRQIEPILTQAEGDLLRLRMAHQPRVEDIFGKTKETLKTALMPEQQAKLDELYGRLQKRWESDRQYVHQLESAGAKAPPGTSDAPPK